MKKSEEIKERLESFRKKQGLTVTEFEDKGRLGLAYWKRTKGMSVDKLFAVLDAFPELSLEWVLFGRGEMLGGGGGAPAEEEPREEPKEDAETLREKVALLEKMIRDKEVIISLLEKTQGRV